MFGGAFRTRFYEFDIFFSGGKYKKAYKGGKETIYSKKKNTFIV